jgi:peptidoglycan/xylan/chitin deacetylase (PgdA/CDA1 family)
VVRARLALIVVAVVAVLGVTALPTNDSAARTAGSRDASPSPSPSVSASPSLSPSPSPSAGDTTPPVTVVGGADDRWHRVAVRLTLTATDAGSGVASTWYRIDDGVLKEGTSVLVPAPAHHTGDGEHLVTFFSLDRTGNQEAPQQVTVRIDTTPPVLRWAGLSPSAVTTQTSLTARFALREAHGPVAWRLQVYGQYGALVLHRAGPRPIASRAGSITVPLTAGGRRFAPGVYRLRLTLSDQAGNRAVTGFVTFRDVRPVEAKVTFDLPRAGRRVALTFDDGNDKAAWARIVTVLRSYRVHGTFFALGPRVAAYGALARRTVAAGDAIGSHGWTHTDMALQTAPEIRKELTMSAAAWWRVARVSPIPYMRPPYGATGPAVLTAAGAEGFAHVMLWDVDPQDWKGIAAGEVAQRVLSHVHPGAIVCLHTLPNTAAALPQILSGLRAMGYRECSLPELFAAAARRR